MKKEKIRGKKKLTVPQRYLIFFEKAQILADCAWTSSALNFSNSAFPVACYAGMNESLEPEELIIPVLSVCEWPSERVPNYYTWTLHSLPFQHFYHGRKPDTFFFYLDPAKIDKSTVVPNSLSITVFHSPGACYTNCISEQLVKPATVILDFPALFFKNR